MREIKFRAWHKKLQRIYSITSIDFKHQMISCPCQDECETGIDGFSFDEIELMQYTGLKDKNGIEIYEGDILAIEGATAKVVFWERPPAFGLDFSHNEDKWCEDWNLSDDSERMEIVGNVYANPELLTK